MDIYSKAIEFLKNNPSKIGDIWDDPKSHFAGVLFQAVTPTGECETNADGDSCGDICEIHSILSSAWTRELEQAILNDYRIPKIYASHDYKPKITPEMLEMFAEWQRKIDSILGRNPENFKYEQ